MSKKHFIALADVLRGERVPPAVLDAICRFRREQNRQFNEERFRQYLAGECGPCGGKIKRKAGDA